MVVLRAEGRSFSAGYDIGPNPARAARRGNALAWHESLTDDVRLEMTPWDMRKPVIASVQGHCLGGGCEMVMMCDLTVAADDALFGEPEIRFSNVGPVMIMPFIIGLKRAREMLYLGDPIDAQTALSYGMVNRVVPRAELSAATMKLARRMALISPEALAGDQAGDQSRRRRRRLPQRHPRRPRRARPALCGADGGRDEVRRDQGEGRARRRPPLARRPVRGVTKGDTTHGN